jgi:hypothetical protein
LHGSGGGIIEAKGDVYVDGAGAWGGDYNVFATIKVNGTGTQEYASPNGTGHLPHVEVNKASGTFQAASGTTTIRCTSLKLVAGTVDAAGGGTPVTWKVGGSGITQGTHGTSSGASYTNSNLSTREVFAYTGGTWAGGTIELDGQGFAYNTRNVNISSAFTANNFTFTGGSGALSAWGGGARTCYYVLTGAANLIVTGLLKFKEDSTNPTYTDPASWKVNASGGGIIEARGNLLVEVAETLAGTAAVTLSGTGDQTITETAGEWPAGLWTNSNTAGKVRQATAVTLGGDLDIDASATWCTHGYDFEVNDLDIDAAGTFLKHGTETITVNGTTTGTTTTGSCYPYHIAVGSSPMDWSVAANWLPASVPTSSDDVVLDNAIDVNIDAAAVCASLTSSGYSGTLTQEAGNTLTVSGDIAWAAGTFTGSASQVQCETFSLTAGTWTSGSGQTLLVSHDNGVKTVLLYSGGTFNESTGTVKFAGNHYGYNKTISVTSALSLYNLSFEGGWSHASLGNYVFTTSAALTITNDLTIERTYSNYMRLQGGTINLEGNYSVAASGTNQYCSTEVHFTGNTPQTYSSLGGFGPIMVCPSGSTSVVSPKAGEEAVTHSASALFIKSGFAGTFVAPSGTFATTGTSNATTNIFEFAAGTYTHSSGTLKFIGSHYGYNKAISVTAALSLYDLKIEGGWSHSTLGSYVFTTSAALTITNDLTIERTYSNYMRLTGGTIVVNGDVTTAAAALTATTTAVTLAGSGNQTITQADVAGLLPGGTWTNSNTGGVVLQATDVTLGGDLDIDANARWCMEGYNLTVNSGTPGSITNNGELFLHGASLPSPDPGNTTAGSHEDSGGITTSSFQPIESGAIYGAPGIASSLHSIETGIAT